MIVDKIVENDKAFNQVMAEFDDKMQAIGRPIIAVSYITGEREWGFCLHPAIVESGKEAEVLDRIIDLCQRYKKNLQQQTLDALAN